jgi:hypothetical protein
MPDEELFAAAAAGELRDRANVQAHARRLLDAKGADGIANFSYQVFRLGTYDGIVRNPADFPNFTAEMPAAMRQEVIHFFDWTFKEGLGVRDFYTSPVGFVNSDLAPLYGLEGEFSRDTFTKVDLDPTLRSGFLTQAGFLSSYVSDTEPDIIHRGVFIATRLLCIKLPPPAPNAGHLPDIQPDMTNRERVETTTGKGTCGEGCHTSLLNPLGYGFENYDALGQYRTLDRDLPVDAGWRGEVVHERRRTVSLARRVQAAARLLRPQLVELSTRSTHAGGRCGDPRLLRAAVTRRHAVCQRLRTRHRDE